MVRKLKRLKCPVDFCMFELKHRSQIGLMTMAYDHVVKNHTLIDIKNEDVKIPCPVIDCNKVITGYTRNVALLNMYSHIENHVPVVMSGQK